MVTRNFVYLALKNSFSLFVYFAFITDKYNATRAKHFHTQVGLESHRPTLYILCIMMRPITVHAAVVPHKRKELLFWLALVLSFRCNFAITQNYQVESLDDTRNALMSYATGSSKPGGKVHDCL